ncbi:MAG: FdtA/QdtA family cupin domain-containing protein [Bacteroidaceae bacterium]|nr:FdtA/QdtA family cupin domain-containing protein [Bacteroidaceae bacterium]
MSENVQNALPMGCRLIGIPHVGDNRGALAFAEARSVIPFDIRRVFWIYDVPVGAHRGGHAHWTCAEVVVPVSGGFTMVVDDGRRRTEVKMGSPTTGILVPAGVWCELKDFKPGTVLAVMASHPYDATGYVHDYEAFLKAVRTLEGAES